MIRNPLDLKPGGQPLKIRAARFYSDVFSPPSVFALFGFIIAWSELPFWKGSLHASIFGAFSSLVPLAYIIVLLKRGLISDIHLSHPHERKVPYLLGILGAVLAYGLLWWMDTPSIFLSFIVTNIIGLGLLAVINSRWLISAHTTTITAVVTFVGFEFNLFTALLLSPFILFTIYIRYYLKRHTIGELISGVVLGFVIVLGQAATGLIKR